MIFGDFNADVQDLPVLSSQLSGELYVDVGHHADIWQQPQDAPTCFATPTSQGTRRDYAIVSADMVPYISSFH
eukprot:9732812-Karenia_brevis.AAC.1